jgi:hypothetical protein
MRSPPNPAPGQPEVAELAQHHEAREGVLQNIAFHSRTMGRAATNSLSENTSMTETVNKNAAGSVSNVPGSKYQPCPRSIP